MIAGCDSRRDRAAGKALLWHGRSTLGCFRKLATIALHRFPTHHGWRAIDRFPE
jgi:hypothetical protein